MLHLAACLCQIFIQKASFVFRGQTISLNRRPAGFPFLLSFSRLFFALLFIAFSCCLVIICLYRSLQTLTFQGAYSIYEILGNFHHVSCLCVPCLLFSLFGGHSSKSIRANGDSMYRYLYIYMQCMCCVL